jgi:hypothetical protein
MKKRSLGCPSSDKRNIGLEKEVKSCISRVEAETLTFLKYGAALDKAIIKAG